MRTVKEMNDMELIYAYAIAKEQHLSIIKALKEIEEEFNVRAKAFIEKNRKGIEK